LSRIYLSVELEAEVIADAGSRCGYCQSDETLTGIPLSIEHVIPVSLGGQTVRDNLWRSCRPCNERKSAQVSAIDPQTGETAPLFHPRAQRWREHFQWSADGLYIIGLTPTGRATIEALQLNRSLLIAARQRWVGAGWHPPSDPA